MASPGLRATLPKSVPAASPGHPLGSGRAPAGHPLGAGCHSQGIHALGQGTAMPWPFPDCPLTQGTTAQGMTAIPSLSLATGDGLQGMALIP